MTRSEVASYLFKDEYGPSWRLLEELLPELEGIRYQFMDPVEYERVLLGDTARGMAVYWREMLHRTHWAAAGSLIRTHRWMSGLLDALVAENLIVFCSCARGIIESSADTWYSLDAVAPTLAAAKNGIARALAGQLTERLINKDIEDKLIHFTFARGKQSGEAHPDQHRAHHVATYLQCFEKEQPSIRQYYAKLCDIVHPGAGSIVSYARALDPNSSGVMLTLEEEPRVLAYFAAAFRVLLPLVMASGFNVGIMTLRTLNALPALEVHTPFLDSVTFKPTPAWEMIENLLAVPAQ